MFFEQEKNLCSLPMPNGRWVSLANNKVGEMGVQIRYVAIATYPPAHEVRSICLGD